MLDSISKNSESEKKTNGAKTKIRLIANLKLEKKHL